MITKVIKHDIIRTRSTILGHYSVAAVVAAGASGLAALDWPVLSALAVPAGALASVGLFIGVLVFLGVDYWRTSFGTAGYLTQTIPVRGAVLYAGKFLHGLGVMIVTALVSLALGLLVWAGVGGVREGLVTLWDSVSGVLPWWGWALAALTLLTSLAAYLAQVFFAAAIGSESRLRPMGAGGPVLVWVITYVVFQLSMVLALVLVPLGIGVGADGSARLEQLTFARLLQEGNDLAAVPLGFVVGMLVMLVAMVWRSVVSWEKKVSLA